MRTLILLLILSSSAQAFSLFDGLYKKVDQKIDAKVADEVLPIKDNQISLIQRLGKLEARMEVQANVVAGVNNKVSSMRQDMQAGGDINNGASDDLLKFIFDKWGWIIGSLFSFIGTLMAGVWGIMKWQGAMYERLLNAKDLWIKNLLDSSQKKDQANDEWLQKYIELITKRG